MPVNRRNTDFGKIKWVYPSPNLGHITCWYSPWRTWRMRPWEDPMPTSDAPGSTMSVIASKVRELSTLSLKAVSSNVCVKQLNTSLKYSQIFLKCLHSFSTVIVFETLERQDTNLGRVYTHTHTHTHTRWIIVRCWRERWRLSEDKYTYIIIWFSQ